MYAPYLAFIPQRMAASYFVRRMCTVPPRKTTIALIRRGGPGSERTRHIALRHFWLKERLDSCDVTVIHVPTTDMVANILTKPVQGNQFANADGVDYSEHSRQGCVGPRPAREE
jgi:hypothetical protein